MDSEFFKDKCWSQELVVYPVEVEFLNVSPPQMIFRQPFQQNQQVSLRSCHQRQWRVLSWKSSGIEKYCSNISKIAVAISTTISEMKEGDFPGGPMVKNPPWSVETQVQSLVGELRSHMPRGYWAHVPQLESPHDATKTWCSQINK